jgi:hypothetical protein
MTTQHQHMDPRIGILNSGVHYAFVNGYDQPEVRGTREQVEVALGLRPAARPRQLPSLKRYEVTVTPSVIGHSSAGAHGAYVEEVDALNSRDAITQARRAYRDEEGRFAPVATYRAKRVD